MVGNMGKHTSQELELVELLELVERLVEEEVSLVGIQLRSHIRLDLLVSEYSFNSPRL